MDYRHADNPTPFSKMLKAQSRAEGANLTDVLAAERAERERKREYAICRHAVGVLSEMCAMPPERIIELLTGQLWDEEEAAGIKAANITGEALPTAKERTK